MPHKFNASRRHKFAKKQYRVTNWAEYNESLRNRGDLTIWITGDVQNHWAVLSQSFPPIFLCVEFCHKFSENVIGRKS